MSFLGASTSTLSACAAVKLNKRVSLVDDRLILMLFPSTAGTSVASGPHFHFDELQIRNIPKVFRIRLLRNAAVARCFSLASVINSIPRRISAMLIGYTKTG